MSKIYLVRLDLELFDADFSNIIYGAYLDYKKASDRAEKEFIEYCEMLKDRDDFKMSHTDPDNYSVSSEAIYAELYIEEVDIAENQEEIKEGSTVYISRYDNFSDSDLPIEIPYLAFTSREDCLRHIDTYFVKYSELGKDKEALAVHEISEEDKYVYWKDMFVSFCLEKVEVDD